MGTSKLIFAVLAGVFIGAFAIEVLNRKRPGLVTNAHDKAVGKLGEFREAFKEGYAGGAEPAEEG